jgi:hypothetical protein
MAAAPVIRGKKQAILLIDESVHSGGISRALDDAEAAHCAGTEGL